MADSVKLEQSLCAKDAAEQGKMAKFVLWGLAQGTLSGTQNGPLGLQAPKWSKTMYLLNSKIAFLGSLHFSNFRSGAAQERLGGWEAGKGQPEMKKIELQKASFSLLAKRPFDVETGPSSYIWFWWPAWGCRLL